MSDNVINLDDHRPHMTAYVACLDCAKDWIAVAPADTVIFIEQLVATNEALVKERDQWIEHTKNAVWADSEELKLANARAERLEAALRGIVDRDLFHDDQYLSADLVAKLEAARAALITEKPHDRA